MVIGYIYKIYDNTNGSVYYGSTKETISRRVAGHRASYNRWVAGKKYCCKSFEILKNGDYAYSLVEQVEYDDKLILHQRERFYIENNECVNKNVPTRTMKEWREEHKEDIVEYKKEYYQEHKDEVNAKAKEYYQENRDEVNAKRKENREQHKDELNAKSKEYYQKNRDEVNAKRKENREQHKDELNAKRKEYRLKNRDEINAKQKENRLKKKAEKEASNLI